MNVAYASANSSGWNSCQEGTAVDQTGPDGPLAPVGDVSVRAGTPEQDRVLDDLPYRDVDDVVVRRPVGACRPALPGERDRLAVDFGGTRGLQDDDDDDDAAVCGDLFDYVVGLKDDVVFARVRRESVPPGIADGDGAAGSEQPREPDGQQPDGPGADDGHGVSRGGVTPRRTAERDGVRIEERALRPRE